MPLIAERVLVTDGDERAALALVRSLGRAGHEVYVCSTSGQSIAGASRYAQREWRVADPLAAPARFVAEITALARGERFAVVLPVSEAALLALLPVRGDLPHTSIPFPSLESFSRISDKAAVLEAAPAAGIAVPRQRLLGTADERSALAHESLPFPLVVKPARSVTDEGKRRVKHGAHHAADAEELEWVLEALDPSAYPVLLQQRIVGPGVGIFVLLWDGELLAAFAHRRIREKPPSGGVSVYRESIPADPDLVARSVALLRQFDWQGVAMVEYKRDERSGTPYLMEVNGRFWGSLQLAIDAGVDFPLLLLDADRGRPRRVRSYRVGVRSRWEWGDVDHLLARMRRSPEALALPSGAPGRWAVVRDFLKWRRGDRGEVLRIGDPRPFLRETVQWLRQATRRDRASASSTSTATTPATAGTRSRSSENSRADAESASSG